MDKEKGCFVAIIQVAKHIYIKILPSLSSKTRFLLTIQDTF